MNTSFSKLMFRLKLLDALILLFLFCLPNQQLFSQVEPSTLEDYAGGKSVVREIDLQFDANGTTSTVLVEVVDGQVFLDGDIFLGTEAEVFSGAAIRNVAAHIWTNSTMPYILKAGYTTEEQNMIHYAINHVNSNSNLCLIPRTTEENYVEFNKDAGDVCFSAVGMSGGKQIINVSSACGIGATIHEILHAAGHWHEQSRADRDDYVTIDLTTVAADKQHNFNKYAQGADVGTYDYNSIMHYGENAFGTNTITVKTPPGTKFTDIGQRLNMSAGDIAGVNHAYTASPSCAEITGLPVNLNIKSFGDISVDFGTGMVTVTGIIIENSGHTAAATCNFVLVAINSSNSWVKVSDYTIPALNPGETHTISTATLDASTLGDDAYTFAIWTDNTNQITEGSEIDNYHFWTFPILDVPLCEANAALVGNAVTHPTTCGGSDGAMELIGLTNGQSYMVNYKKDGVALNPSLTFTASGTTHTITALEQGVYTEINISTDNCTSVNYERTLQGPAPAPPVISLSCDPELLMSNEAPTGWTYQWYKDDALIDGATSQTYTPTGVGEYEARFLNGLCDSDTSDVLIIQDLSGLPTGISTGTGLDFDGTDDHVSTAGTLIENVTDYTIELWFKMAAYPASTENLFDFGIDGNIHQYLAINTSSFTYYIKKWNGSGVTTYSISSNTQPTLNEWNHVAITYDDDTQAGKLYLNGIEVGSATLGLKPADYQEFSGAPHSNYIGRSISFGNSVYFQGQIDEFRYWTTTKSLQTINDNRFCSVDCLGDLLLYLPFEDGTAGGTNTSLTETVGYTSSGSINGSLDGFGLSGATSNFVAATGIPACSITAPEINLKGLDISIAAGDNTPSVTDDTDFGNIFGVWLAHTHTFTIENTGTSNLTIGTITSDETDFEVTQPASTTITAGNSTTFTVRFYPKTLGTQTAVISIPNNDANENPYEFTVTGNTKDYIESAQTGDWNVGTTWVGGVVPVADDRVTILSGHNVSVVATEVIAGIEVDQGGTLTVTASGTLDVDDVSTNGIRNEGTIANAGIIKVDNSEGGIYNLGTFNNSGQLDIGNTGSVGISGFNIVNSSGSPGVLNNLPNGIININRSTGSGINLLGNSAIFTNEGTVNIGSISDANAIVSGINFSYEYTCTLLNKSTGTINIDNTSDSGIKIWEGIVTNEGTINLGANSAIGRYGILSYGNIVNASGGIMNIDNAERSGLHFLTGAGSNAGTINIGANSSLGNQGIRTQVTYDNSGVINIDNTPIGVSVSTGPFNNAGTVTIGANTAVATLVSATTNGFNNNAQGTLYGTGSINSFGFVNNGGTLSPGYSPGIQTFTSTEDFTNSIIEIEVNGSTTAGTDFDQIVVNGTATLGGTLNLTINSTPMGTVTILDATSLSGTFATVNGLPNGLMLQYDYPNAGEVSLVGCDLAISTPPTNQEVCDGDDVTFSVAATSSAGGLSYQWQKIVSNAQTPWTQYNNTTNGFPNNNQINGIFVNGSTTYACTHGGGLGVFDGTSWTSITTSNSSIPSDIMYDAVMYDGKLHVATTQGTGVYDGSSWTVINTSTSGYPRSVYTQAIYTADGILYVGTLGGVGVFDGTSWFYADANTPGFPQAAFPYTSNITSITKLNGVVYAGTARSGLAVYDGTSWSTIDNNTTGFPASNNVEVVYASNGKLYVGTQNGLGIYDGSTWTTVDENTTGFSGSYVSGLYEADGKLYVGTGSGHGMNVYDGSSWTNVTATDLGLSGGLRVYDIHIEGGTTTLATLSGVAISPTAPAPTNISTGGTAASYTFTPQEGDENCTYQVVITDANGCTVTSNAVGFSDAAPENCCDLAISTPPTNQEVCDGDDVTFSVAATSTAGDLTYQWQQICPSASSDWINIGSSGTPGFPTNNQINDVYFADGLLYAGSHQDGLGVYDGTSWTKFNSSTPGYPNMDAVYSIMKGDDGKLYISTGTAGGLGIYDGTSWTHIPIWGGPTGFASVTIQDLYVSGDNIYLASWGVNIFDGTSWTAHPPTTTGFPGTYAHSITESNGIVYVGTDGGLGIYDGTSWTTVNSSTPGFPADKVESVEVHNGKVYAGTPNGLAIYDGTTWMTIDNTTAGFPNNYIYEVYLEGDKIYLAASGGVGVFDGTTWTTIPQSEIGHSPYSIHVDNGNIYLGTLQGVAIPPTDIVTDISTGGTAASYTFTPQEGDENCTYQVVVTDANDCSVTSNAVGFSAAAPESCCTAEYISTLYGLGTKGFSGDGNAATMAEFYFPNDLVYDANGNLFISDASNNVIRKVDANTGNISTIAGTGTQGFGGDGGQATAAELNVPRAITFDANGDLFVADANNNRVRKIDMTTGVITTVVGNGNFGGAGDGGQATLASINFPAGIVFNSAGEMFIIDSNNSSLRRINTNGIIETLSYDFSLPQQLAIDANDDLYVADFLNHQIKKLDASNGFTSSVIAGTGTSGYAGDGGLATAAQINLGQGNKMVFDGVGNLYFADAGNHVIRKVDASTGIITTIAGTGTAGYSGDNGLATQATLNYPNAIAFNPNGKLLIADSQNDVIRIIDCQSDCTVAISDIMITYGDCRVAGNSQVSVTASCDGCTVEYSIDGTNFQTSNSFTNLKDSTYTIIVRDQANPSCRAIGKVTLTEDLDIIAPTVVCNDLTVNLDASGMATITPSQVDNGSSDNCSATGALDFSLSKNTFTCDDLAGVTGVPCVQVSTLAGMLNTSGNAEGTGAAAGFNQPRGVAVDAAGNVFMTDERNHVIRKITPAGVVTTFAGMSGEQGSQDGTGTAARFTRPAAITIDAMGNLYVGSFPNIRKITPAGVVTTFVGSGVSGSADGNGANATFTTLRGLAFDKNGNLYSAGFNNTIRRITPAGVVTTIAGMAGQSGSADGNGSAARFSIPQGVVVDNDDNVYVADFGNNTIRKITPNGDVTTLAGMTGEFGFADGTGTAARFSAPSGLAIDQDGNLYLADQGNGRIRRITATGEVTTIAGTGVRTAQDGNSSTASFGGAFGLTVEAATGNIYVADLSGHTVRKIEFTPNCLTTTLTVTDEVGNSASCLVQVNVTDTNDYCNLSSCDILVEDVQATESVCQNATDGVIEVAAHCGTCTGAVEYSIDGTNFQTSSTFAGLGAGNYTVQIRDAINPTCTATYESTITIGSTVCGTCDPNDLTLNDNPIAADTYHTSKSITSSGTVAANTTVVFKATQTITLQAGFHAVAGSDFTGMIEACQATLVESELLDVARVGNQASTPLEAEATPSVKVFPNPTTYRANINLTLPAMETIQLDLFDLSGKRVANLVRDVTLPAGVHHYEWECNQVEAGMYLVVLNGRVVSRLAVVR